MITEPVDAFTVGIAPVASNDASYYGQSQATSAPANPNEANTSPDLLLMDIQSVEADIKASMARQGIDPSHYQGIRIPSTQEMLANPSAYQSMLLTAKHEAEKIKNDLQAKELQGMSPVYNHPEGNVLAMLGVRSDAVHYSPEMLSYLSPPIDLPNLIPNQQIAKNDSIFKQRQLGA